MREFGVDSSDSKVLTRHTWNSVLPWVPTEVWVTRRSYTVTERTPTGTDGLLVGP